MKKILFLLLLTCASYAQTSTGQEQEFDYSIKNNASQTVINPNMLVTEGADGTYGKVSVNNVPISTAVRDSLNKKLNLPTGFLQGLQLSINADPTKYNIASGYYVVTDFTNLAQPVVKIITYPGATGITPTYLASANSTYVALDKNMNIVSSASPFTDAQRRTLAIIGNVVHSNYTTINVTNEIKAPIVALGNQLHDFMKAIGFLNESGNIYSPNGANLQLNKSAGDIFGMGINSADYLNPHKLTIAAQTALTFAYRFQNGTQLADTQNVNPNIYDVGGVNTATPSNKWTIQRINLFQSGLARIQPGQTVYNSFIDATTALPTQPFVTEQNIADNAVFRCYLIVQQGTTNLQAAVAGGTAQFVPVDKFGNVIGNGSVALTYANIIAALGYTPENEANKQNSLAIDGTGQKFPTVDAVNDKLLETNSIDGASIDWTGLGDSITYGVGSTSGSTSYFDIISGQLPWKSTTKLGYSGATVMPISGRTKLSDITPLIPAGTDLITVMIGVNDWDNDNPLGDVYETLKKSHAALDETASFAEAFRFNLENIKYNYPNAKIIVITPTKTKHNWSGLYDLKYYVDIEIAIANFLSIPVINAFENSGIYYNDTLYLNDGLHPNDLGYQLIAKKVLAGIIDTPENRASNSFSNLRVSDDLTIGGTAQSGSDGKVFFKGFTGLTHGRMEIYPYAGSVPSISIYANGDSVGGGFSYFNAPNGRYGFGTATDNGTDKVQINGSVSLATNLTSSTGDLILSDTNGFIFRGIRASSWTDSQNSRFFQIGSSGDNVVYTTQFGSIANRMLFSSSKTQFSPEGYNVTVPPVGVFEVLNSATNVAFNVSTGGKTLINTTTDNGVDYLQVNGSMSATSYTGSATLTGTPTAPTAALGTNTTQIATTAFVTTATGNYKKYVAILNQVGTSAPTATVLENTLGGTVVWTRGGTGAYSATLTGAFVSAKTTVLVSNGAISGKNSTAGRFSNDVISLSTSGFSTLEDTAIVDGTIEIRVYN